MKLLNTGVGLICTEIFACLLFGQFVSFWIIITSKLDGEKLKSSSFGDLYVFTLRYFNRGKKVLLKRLGKVKEHRFLPYLIEEVSVFQLFTVWSTSRWVIFCVILGIELDSDWRWLSFWDSVGYWLAHSIRVICFMSCSMSAILTN